MCFVCSDSTVPRDADARRVHEHVHPAVALAVLGDDPYAVFLRAHVRCDRERAELGGRCFHLLGCP